MKIQCVRSCLATTLALMVAGAAFGDTVYKWTDAKGAVHYTEMPPGQQAGGDGRLQRLSPTDQELARARTERQRAQRETAENEAKREAEMASLWDDTLPSVPGETGLLREDQRAVMRLLVPFDALAAPDCFTHRVRDTKRSEPGSTATATVERWTLDRCGQPIEYEVSVTALPDGVTRFTVTRE